MHGKPDHPPKSPPNLTGGVWNTLRKATNLKKPKFSKDFAVIIASGFDTVEETFDLTLDKAFLRTLEQAKEKAKDNGEPSPVVIAGNEFLVAGHGGKNRVQYQLSDGDFFIRIRSPKERWGVSIRYLSGALWCEGIDALQARLYKEILRALQAPSRGEKNGSKWDRSLICDSVKRADFAFDFYSPEFSEQMKGREGWKMLQRIVAHKEVKWRPVGGSVGLQTICIGSKQSLEVTVYDKGREIREVSGKEWMFDLWKKNGWPGPDEKGRAKDVWRLEIRMGKEYLKERGINRFDEVRLYLKELVYEALLSRRLTNPNRDSNAARWPLHPLWWLASQEHAVVEMRPLGKVLTMRKKELAGMLHVQAVGVLRAASVLTTDDFTYDDVEPLIRRAEDDLREAVNDRGKTEGLQDRYRTGNKPR